ncbi:MAG: hypothetical protein AAGC93_13575 [Cyanobacteria bacterium P01_F01_bin.53]
MKFSTQQLPSGKWGIYSGECLLATVDCQSTCETILANFVSGRRDAPDNDVNELYQAHQLRHEKAAAEKVALEEKAVSSTSESARAGAQTTTSGQSNESADKVTQSTGVKASATKTPSPKSKTKSKTKRKPTSAKRARKPDKRSQATPASA